MAEIKTPEHKYKHIIFEKVSDSASGKTATFSCENHDGTPLGAIDWMCGWRQYCFFPLEETLYSQSCLKDIADFISKLMEDRKQRLQGGDPSQ